MDYKKLYEQALLTLSGKKEKLTQNKVAISDLKFEMDKLRRHLFGSKSEKRDN